MDHQSFRFYIPGIVFLFSIYFVICWITVHYYTDSEFRTFVLLGGITPFPVISLPVGWWIFNAYRVWWLGLTKGDYENKDFVKLIREDLKPFFSPTLNAFLIDFSCLDDVKSWLKIDSEILRKKFYPFTSQASFQEEIEKFGACPKFTEPVIDSAFFPPMVAQMIAVGEETSELDLMLLRVAGIFEKEIQSKVEVLSSVIEPVLIFFLGVLWELFLYRFIFLCLRWQTR